jgi:hypothetical protein
MAAKVFSKAFNLGFSRTANFCLGPANLISVQFE